MSKKKAKENQEPTTEAPEGAKAVEGEGTEPEATTDEAPVEETSTEETSEETTEAPEGAPEDETPAEDAPEDEAPAEDEPEPEPELTEEEIARQEEAKAAEEKAAREKKATDQKIAKRAKERQKAADEFKAEHEENKAKGLLIYGMNKGARYGELAADADVTVIIKTKNFDRKSEMLETLAKVDLAIREDRGNE